jgi:hypothetical protein
MRKSFARFAGDVVQEYAIAESKRPGERRAFARQLGGS